MVAKQIGFGLIENLLLGLLGWLYRP